MGSPDGFAGGRRFKTRTRAASVLSDNFDPPPWECPPTRWPDDLDPALWPPWEYFPTRWPDDLDPALWPPWECSPTAEGLLGRLSMVTPRDLDGIQDFLTPPSY